MDNLGDMDSDADSKNLLIQLMQPPQPSVDLDDPTAQLQCVSTFDNASGTIIIDPFTQFEQSNDKFPSETLVTAEGGGDVALPVGDSGNQSYEVIAAYPSTTGYYITSESGQHVYEIPPSTVTQQILVNGDELFLLQEDSNYTDNGYETIMLQPVDYPKTGNMSEFAINWPADEIDTTNNTIELIVEHDQELTNQEAFMKSLPKPSIKPANHCSICEMSYQSPRDYRQHMTSHENEKPHKCDLCTLNFNHLINLRVHRALDHSNDEEGNNSSECPICRKHFSRQSSYLGHLRSHEVEEDLVCVQCFKIFKTQLILDHHYNDHKREGFPFMQEQQKRGFKCKLCPDMFVSSIGMLRRHYVQCHPNTGKKKSGDEPVSNSSEGAASSTADSKPTIRKSKQKAKDYLTDIINSVKSTKMFSGTGSHSAYLRKSKISLPCNYCEKTFSKKCLLDRHLVSHTKEKQFFCEVCRKGFTQKSSLKTHMNIHYFVKLHICPDCGKVLKYRHTFRKHVCKGAPANGQKRNQNYSQFYSSVSNHTENNILRSILNDNNDHIASNNENNKNAFKSRVSLKCVSCRICRLRFRSRNSLLLHQRSQHDSNRELSVCELCDKSFHSKIILRAHTLIQHQAGDNTTAHICHHCNVDFPSKQHLHYHFKCLETQCAHKDANAQHIAATLLTYPKPLIWDEQSQALLPVENPTNRSTDELNLYPERNHSCSICPRSYKSLAHLKAHVKQNHDNRRRVSCNRCGTSFCNESNLNTHIRRKHLSPGFKCSVCPHYSSTPSLLKRHMKIHSSAKPYLCPVCKKNFKTKSYCQAHIKNHGDQHQLSGVSQLTDNCVTLNTMFTVTEPSSTAYTDDAQFTVQTAEVPLVNYEITDLTSNYQALVGDDVYIDQGMQHYTIQDVNGDLISLNNHEQDQIKVNQIFQLIRQPDPSDCQPSELESIPIQQSQIIDSDRCTLFNPQSLTVALTHPESALNPNDSTENLSRKCPLLMEALFNNEEPNDKPPTTETKTQQKIDAYYGCTKCDHVFVHPRDLVMHAKQVHVSERPFSCLECSKTFSTRTAVKVHEYKHTTGQHVKYVCPECAQEFANFMSVTRHVATNHTNESGIYRCTKCQVNYNNIRELRHHVDQHVEDTETVAMDKTLIQKMSKNNSSVVFSEEQNEILASVVPTENMTLSEKYLINAAKSKKFPPIAVKGESKARDTNYQSLYTCKECHKNFNRPSSLKRHSYVHTGVKPHSCTQCTRSFKDKINLKLHVENFHSSKRRIYSCHVCSKTFISKGGLKSHMLIHTNHLPFKCSHCDSAFRSDVLLLYHMKKKHSNGGELMSRNMPSLATLAADICDNPSQTMAAMQEFDPGISQMIYIDSVDDPPFQTNLTDSIPFNSIKMDYAIRPMKSDFHLTDNPVTDIGSLTSNQNDIIYISNELGETSQYCVRTNSFVKTDHEDYHRQSFYSDLESSCHQPIEQSSSSHQPTSPEIAAPTRGEVKWLCNCCKELFSMKDNYLNHECKNPLSPMMNNRSIEKPRTVSPRVCIPPSSKRLKCRQCDCTFAYYNDLKKHKASHSASAANDTATVVSCQICSSEFECESDLVNHMTQHYQIRTHICRHCDSVFPTHHQLIQHSQSAHSVPLE